MSAKIALSVALRSLYAVAAAFLLAWMFIGSFYFVRPVSNPLNAEGVLAVSFLLLMLSRTGASYSAPSQLLPFSVAIAAVIVITGLAYLPAMSHPLLHDAYSHVWNAATRSWTNLAHSLYMHPPPGSEFFRPLGDVSFWIDYRWAGTNATAWNLWNLGLHLVNTCLVWLLARRLSLGTTAATITALVFGLHGTRSEVVAWVGARFDLLASFFVIATLLALLRYVDTGAPRWLIPMAVCSCCAFLSKESAYCLPLLALLILPFRDRDVRRRILLGAVLTLAICAIVFAWRTWLLGGVGGYKTETGAPAIFQFSAIRTIKALLFRQWAILLFPINWSSASTLLKCAVVLMLSAAAAFPFYAKASRKYLGVSLLWVIAAALPAQHLLLIGADLLGARMLYLPVLGLALFWGFAVEGCGPGITRIVLPAGLLVFHAAALEHNLAILREVALLSQRTCMAIGAELGRDPRTIVVRNLPMIRDGVFFLRNGFPQCVVLNTGQPIERIFVQEDNPSAVISGRVFTWNERTAKLEETAPKD